MSMLIDSFQKLAVKRSRVILDLERTDALVVSFHDLQRANDRRTKTKILIILSWVSVKQLLSMNEAMAFPVPDGRISRF